MGRVLQRGRKTDWDGIVTLLLTCLLLLLSCGLLLLPFALRVYRSATRAPVDAPQAEVLMLFGKQLVDGKMDDEFRQRVARLVILLRQSSRRMTILLGGTLPGQSVSEAQAAADQLRTADVADQTQLILEQKSQHTLENLRNARQLLGEIGDLRCTLISSRYHLARCQAIATSLGFNAVTCAAEEYLANNWRTLLHLTREACLLTWFHTGRGWARITRNRRMLERVS